MERQLDEDAGNSPVRAGSPETLPDSPETAAFNERCHYYENRDMFDVRGGPCLSPLRLEGERDPFSELDKMLSWKGVNDEVLLYTGPVPDMSFCDEAVAKRKAADAVDAKTKAKDTKKKKKLARLKELEERAKAAAKEFEDAAESEGSGSGEKEDAPIVADGVRGKEYSVTQAVTEEVGDAKAFGTDEVRNATDEKSRAKERAILNREKESESPKRGKKTKKNDERSSAKKERAMKKKRKDAEKEKGVSRTARDTKKSSVNAEALKKNTERDDAEDVENNGKDTKRTLQEDGRMEKQKGREAEKVTEIASQLEAKIAVKVQKKRVCEDSTKTEGWEAEKGVANPKARKKRKRQEDAKDAESAKQENKDLAKEDAIQMRKEREKVDAIETAKKLAARALAKEDIMARQKDFEVAKESKKALKEEVDEVQAVTTTLQRNRESAIALSRAAKSAKEEIEKKTMKMKRKEKEGSKLAKSETRKTKDKSVRRREAEKDNDNPRNDNDKQKSKRLKGKDKDMPTSRHGELIAKNSPPVGKQLETEAALPKLDSNVVQSNTIGRNLPTSKKKARTDGSNRNLKDVEPKHVTLPANRKRVTNDDARNGRTESVQKTRTSSKNLRSASESKEDILKAKANNERGGVQENPSCSEGAAASKANSEPVTEKKENSKQDTERKSRTCSRLLKDQILLDALPDIRSITRKTSSARVAEKNVRKIEKDKPSTEERRLSTKKSKADTGKSAKLEAISAVELKEQKSQSAATRKAGATALGELVLTDKDKSGNARFGSGEEEHKSVSVVLPRRPTAEEERNRLLVEEEKKKIIVAEKDRKRLLTEEEERQRMLAEGEENKKKLVEEEKKQLSAEEEKKRLPVEEKGKRLTAKKEEQCPTTKEDGKRSTAEEEGKLPKVEEERNWDEGGEFRGPRGNDSENNDRLFERDAWNHGFERGSYNNGHAIPAHDERGRYERNDYRERHSPDNTNRNYRRDEWRHDMGHDMGRVQPSFHERRGDWNHGNRRGQDINRHYDGSGEWNRDWEPSNRARSRARGSWDRENYREGSAPEQGYDRHRTHYERNDYAHQGREGASNHQRPPSHDRALAPPFLGQSVHTMSNSFNGVGQKRQRESHHYPAEENAVGPACTAPCATSSMQGRAAAGQALKKHCANALRGPLWKPQNLQDVNDARNLYRSTFEKAKLEYQRLLDENSRKPTPKMISIAKASATGCYNLAMMSEKKWLIVRANCEREDNAELKTLSKEAFDFYSYLSRNFCCKRIAEIKQEQFPEEHAWFLRLQSKAKLRLLDMNRLHNRDMKAEVAAAQQYLVEAVSKKEKVMMGPEMLKSLSLIVERDQHRLKLCEDTNGTGESSEMPGFETLVEFLPFPSGS